MQKKAPTKKQIAARKKFVAMVRKKAAKKKAAINDTIVRIPSKTRKVRKVTLKRTEKGTFTKISGVDSFTQKNIDEYNKYNHLSIHTSYKASLRSYALLNGKRISKTKALKLKENYKFDNQYEFYPYLVVKYKQLKK